MGSTATKNANSILKSDFPGIQFFKKAKNEEINPWQIFIDRFSDMERGRIIIELQTFNKNKSSELSLFIRLLQSLKRQFTSLDPFQNAIEINKVYKTILSSRFISKYRRERHKAFKFYANLFKTRFLIQKDGSIPYFQEVKLLWPSICISFEDFYFDYERTIVIQKIQSSKPQKQDEAKRIHFLNQLKQIDQNKRFQICQQPSGVFILSDEGKEFQQKYIKSKKPIRSFVFEAQKLNPNDIVRMFPQISIIEIILTLYEMEKQTFSPSKEQDRVNAIIFFQSFRFRSLCQCDKCINRRGGDIRDLKYVSSHVMNMK